MPLVDIYLGRADGGIALPSLAAASDRAVCMPLRMRLDGQPPACDPVALFETLLLR